MTASSARASAPRAALPASGSLTYSGVDLSSLPLGEPGRFAIIASLEPVANLSGVLILRNNTGAPIEGFEVEAVGRDAAGGIVGTASSNGAGEPSRVEPGSIGMIVLYIGGQEVPDDATWEYTIRAAGGRREQLRVETVNIDGWEISGQVVNPNTTPVEGVTHVLLTCFSPTGALTGYTEAFAEDVMSVQGATAPFRAVVFRGPACDHFIAGASGVASPPGP